ncbi:olfactory receptor 6K3-like [Rana temporaria]|uniref:olfactory receptor 6K3-like n=1 Tax=Rana temporaria TaxID=8407 RepID=UPI001AACFBEB|nr:olfactory receptor 6K3-like [Rana temporaria]
MAAASNTSTSFVLLGLMELEKQKYLYFSLSAMVYSYILTLSSVIIYAILKERSLHEPMYILIATLLFNGIFGSSSFFPKFMMDLITSSKKISRTECLIQNLCISTFAVFEMNTFTIMAYDRYLAVCQPLRYIVLLTNEKVVKIISGCWGVTFIILLLLLFLTAALPLCGDKIINIICDNISLVVLACVDSTNSSALSATVFAIYFVTTILVTAFSYFRIFFVCVNLSKESRQKAVHTVVTHLLNFSVFLIGVLFTVLKYRLGNVTLPLTAQVLLSVTPLVFPPLFNPLIYGVRTHALKIKLRHYLWNVILGGKWTQIHTH